MARSPAEAERLAELACRRGAHRVAADLFGEAGDGYRDRDILLAAARCYAQQAIEQAYQRHQYPANVSALTD